MPETDLERWFYQAMLDGCPPDNTAYFYNLDETESTNIEVCAECWLNYTRCLASKGIRYHDVHIPYHFENGEMVGGISPTQIYSN